MVHPYISPGLSGCPYFSTYLLLFELKDVVLLLEGEEPHYWVSSLLIFSSNLICGEDLTFSSFPPINFMAYHSSESQEVRLQSL